MHRINHLAASATFAAITLAGCSSDQINGVRDVSLQAQGVSASASVERPWKGDCDVDAVFTSATTLLITGTCQLAHLGRTTLIAIQTINPGQNGIAYTNAATYTAANGDELRTTNVGIATPAASGLSLSGTETAVGGSGRFADASGTATLVGAVRFTGPASTTGAYSLNGRLEF